MTSLATTALALAALACAAPASAQITFYEHDDFQGRSFSSPGAVQNLAQYGFNDRASSVVVERDQWQVCEDAGWAGRCVTLRPGRYPSLTAMGLNDRVSSVREVRAEARYSERPDEPQPAVEDYRRRGNERLYVADVTSVRAVVRPTEQRCWIEQEAPVQERGAANAGGAVAGALVGGILGHQVGGGSGRDLATVGGVVAGAAIGSQVGRNGNAVARQDVRRCSESLQQSTPEYWDVSYRFRGQDHRMQTATPPGRTITVNHQGEPRV